MILDTQGIVKGGRVCPPLTSASDHGRLGAARRAGAGVERRFPHAVDLFGHAVSVWYTRHMTSHEHPSVDVLDELVRRSQELADLYLRAFDENPSASVDKPHDAASVANLLEALARYILAEKFALDAIGAYAAGKYEPSYGRDF